MTAQSEDDRLKGLPETMVELAVGSFADAAAEVVELSPMQRVLLASHRRNPGSPLQNMSLLSNIQGQIDPRLLAAAFSALVLQTDVLRTRIVEQSGVLTVSVDAEPQKPEYLALDRDSASEWATRRARIPLDLSVRCYDSVVLAHSDGTVSWYLNLHHVITDATSSARVFQKTAELYVRLADGLPAVKVDTDPVDISETETLDQSAEPSYYEWAKDLKGALAPEPLVVSGAADRALAYWQNRKPAQKIGRLYSKVEEPSPDADRAVLPFEGDLLEQAELRIAADYSALSEDLAWTVLLCTATALYLHRLSGEHSLSIGLPVHNRSSPLTRALIGPMMEVFPVDVSIEDDDTHRSLHKRVSRSILKTLQNANPGTSPKADYESIVNVIPRAVLQTFCGHDVTTTWHHPGAIDSSHLFRVQMTSYASPASSGGSGYQFVFDLNSGAAKGRSAAEASVNFMAVVTGLIERPDGHIGHTLVCSPSDEAMLEKWETGPPAEVDSRSVVQRMEDAIASKTYVVIEDADRVVSGQELWQWVLSAAVWMRSEGVTTGDRVAIELGRSIEAVVAIFATLACGGSFVPIDPSQPEERRRRLIDRAQCSLVISSPTLVAAARFQFEPDPDAPEISGEQEAYLLFTSGSTGEPKGVPISHNGLGAYLDFALATYFDSNKPIVAPLFTALTFDLSLTTLFGPLLAFGRLVVIEEDGPQGLVQMAATSEISWCKATPSHLDILVKLLPPNHKLQTVVVGGEAFASRLGRSLLESNSKMALFNEYGPTEAVVGCMIYQVEPDLLRAESEVPIGRPAPGVSLRVVDRYLSRVPPGVTGELLIAHPGVTTGYLEEPTKASEPVDSVDLSLAGDDVSPNSELGSNLVEDSSPFVVLDGQRFYRSGDLVRLMDPERLVYMGRRDEQLKVGGIRLEPIEIEAALDSHPLIERSAVRLWSPQLQPAATNCRRCGLPDNVPGVPFDDIGICQTCYDYERVAPVAASWFKTADDLRSKIVGTTGPSKPRGNYDCLHLLSGGKDSTYALYQLVELGLRPYALTLDNGFISEGAKENVRRSVADLGIDHEFATSEVMNEIFRDSLETYSNVCNGCYKTIYTLATARAVELKTPFIVTGLSRGQLFETRLIPQQFSQSRFDPDVIDRAVRQARRVYHGVDDGPNRLLDTSVFDDPQIFEKVEYIDFYRYFDVELEEMLRYLAERAPWVRPTDTGRSTNCLINAAGIHTHLVEQGYHNYAVPYAWDVRLGHKTRVEAIEELDDRDELASVVAMLEEVGYTPIRRKILTGYYQLAENSHKSDNNAASEQLTPAVLRSYLAELLPAHAIPSAFVQVDALPLSVNGKLDVAALPPPERVYRSSSSLHIEPVNETQAAVIEEWERTLKIEPISIDDDFFVLGGDSLLALEMIVALSDRLGRTLSEELAFIHTTPRKLAESIELEESKGSELARKSDLTPDMFEKKLGSAPRLSSNEKAILFDQATRPEAVMYNSCRVFFIAGEVDWPQFISAFEAVVGCHETLRWNYGKQRLDLGQGAALVTNLTLSDATGRESHEPIRISRTAFDQAADEFCRQPFDLEQGPLVRALVAAIEPIAESSMEGVGIESPLSADQSQVQPTAAVAIAFHHVSGDADSFEILWRQINAFYRSGQLPQTASTYDGLSAWQEASLDASDTVYWLEQGRGSGEAANLTVSTPSVADERGPGFTTRRIAVTPQELNAVEAKSSFSLSLAAIVAAIRPYCDGDEIELGVITSTRNHRLADEVVGYFLNALPIRLSGRLDRSLADLAGDASSAVGAALAHRTYPLARIVADRRKEANVNPNYNGPITAPSILVTFEGLSSVTLDQAPVEPDVLWNADPVADITFFVGERDNAIDLSLEYGDGVLSPAVANDLLEAVDAALRQVVDDASVLVGALAESGSISVLDGPNLDDETLVAERIRRWMAEKPDEVAVVCGDEQLTWGELDQSTRDVADLLRQRGVSIGQRVVVCLPRSVNLLVAMLAVQRAGASYVPIDVSYPRERIELLVEKSQASIGIVETELSSIVQSAVSVTDLRLADASAEAPEDWSIAHGPLGRPMEAYVIFTSGSTGEPKGVAVTHGQLAASTNARFPFYRQDADHQIDHFAMLSSPAFDSSIAGLFWTLADGGTVHLPTEAAVHDIDALIDLLSDSRISHTLMVPTLYQAILNRRNLLQHKKRSEEHSVIAPDGLMSEDVSSGMGSWPTQVVVAGEPCPPALVDLHAESTSGSRLTNEYGPTEATVWSNAYHCVPGRSVPIGKPIPGAWVAVVGDDGLPVRPGVVGQLIIGGAAVTDGYIGSDPETRKRFGNHRSRGRFFRTGDAAVVADDTVFLLGRTDSQLSVNGTRVEPQEVEQVASRVPGIDGVVVVATDTRPVSELLEVLPPEMVGNAMAAAATEPDPIGALESQLRQAVQSSASEGANSRTRLVAHFEAAEQSGVKIEDLRRVAAEALPPLLRPALYIEHKQLPRTPNGKIDRAAAQLLPIPPMVDSVDTATSSNAGPTSIDSATANRMSIELLSGQIVELFRRSLRSPNIGPDDSFFDFGGHSLLAMELLFELEEVHGERIAAGTLYESPTPNQLAIVLVAHQTETKPQTTSSAVAESDSSAAEPSTERARSRTFLVPIQPEGTKPPIFGVHVLGVDSVFFRPLAKRLGDDQPLYGLGQPTTMLDTSVPSAVATIAEAYADEIEEVAPSGPVSLAAVSLGGVVAYELAQQLLRRGRTIGVLALFDGAGPNMTDKSMALSERVAFHMGLLRNDRMSYVLQKVDRQVRNFKRGTEKTELSVRQRLNLPVDHLLEIRQFIESNIEAQHNYDFEPFPGRMINFKATEDPLFDHHMKIKMGWHGLITGGFELVGVPGGHISMLSELYVEKLAEKLAAAHDDGSALARSESDQVPARRLVKRQLIADLGQLKVQRAIARLEQRSDLSVEAELLVTRVGTICETISASVQIAGQQVVATLRDAGLLASLVPVPKRLQFNWGAVAIAGTPISDDAEVATKAMASLGYSPQVSLTGDRSTSDYVRSDESTTRITLRWDQMAEDTASPKEALKGRLRSVGQQARNRVMSRQLGTPTQEPKDLGIFLGTPISLIEPLLRFARAKEGEVLADIGCGDGRVLIQAARQFGCRGIGVEKNERLAMEARANAEAEGLGDRIEIVAGDAGAMSFAGVDIAFAFLPPEVTASLLVPTLTQLNPGGRFITHEQLSVVWPKEPDRTDLVLTDNSITVASLWNSNAH